MVIESMNVIVQPWFYGLGGVVLACVAAYFLFQLTRPVRNSADLDEEYTKTEIGALSSFIRKHYPQIKKELQLRRIEQKGVKSFKQRLEEELIKEYFGEEKHEEKKV